MNIMSKYVTTLLRRDESTYIFLYRYTNQGDQIGLILAYRAMIYFWQCFENDRSGVIF
jgi:hypothetical protein